MKALIAAVLSASVSLAAEYRFEQVTGWGQSTYFAASNDELVYVTEVAEPESGSTIRRLYSNKRGYLVHGEVAQETIDINNRGEVVYNTYPTADGWLLYSTARGHIATNAISPSINDHGEILYAKQGNPWSLHSTIRGLLLDNESYGKLLNDGSFYWIGDDRAIYSSASGKLTTPYPVLYLSANNSGEVTFIKVVEVINGKNRWELFSTMTGQVTNDSFEPFLSEPDCTLPYGRYSTGFGGTDVNDKGEIYFSRLVAVGPEPYEESCQFRNALEIWKATPLPARKPGRRTGKR